MVNGSVAIPETDGQVDIDSDDRCLGGGVRAVDKSRMMMLLRLLAFSSRVNRKSTANTTERLEIVRVAET